MLTAPRHPDHLNHKEAIVLIAAVCKIAGSASFIDDVRADLSAHGILGAVRRRDTPALFDWMVATLSYQGISDEVAAGYMRDHGQPRFYDLQAKLSRAWPCPKLQSYWHYADCGYRKSARTCGQAALLRHCPVPTHDLRNGRLAQMTYSLFLFVRDVMGSDIVGWIDRQLADVGGGCGNRVEHMASALVDPLCHVYGMSDKVVRMMLAELLIGAAGRTRPDWMQVGGSLIAIDTLVHNFLVRTGVQAALGMSHPYGPACYGPSGCASVIMAAAAEIDATTFNSDYPRHFPRFVQNSIWRYCAQRHFDICNGIKITADHRCRQLHCRLFKKCARLSTVK